MANVTRSKELRRIENAIAHRNEPELRWALAECELRKKFRKRHSDLWYQIEKRVRAALTEISANPSDWRLQGQESYLKGVTLTRRQWRETRPGWDHDHCEFCEAKFADERIPDALHAGWTTLDEYRWICDDCYRDFHEQFGWQLQRGSLSDG